MTHTLPSPRRRWPSDPRDGQILALVTFFVISSTGSDFGATPFALASAVTGTLLAQWAGQHFIGASFWASGAWKSATITALSLSILLRASAPWLWFLAGLGAVAAKFIVRFRGKHLFNPACLGIVAASFAAGSDAWVSPGQWGRAPWLLALVVAAGTLVLSSAKRLDIALGFFASYAGLQIARAIVLGDPLVIPLHQLQSGALLIFAFFMITDPRTTPDSRIGRIIFAAVVAGLASWISWSLHSREALFLALLASSPLTPLLDRLFPTEPFTWKRTRKDAAVSHTSVPRLATLILLSLLVSAPRAHAFCGFYVARADTDLFNDASKVVLVRDGQRTVITMASDYRGEPSEFALVVPVVDVPQREQIHVANPALVDHLDAYTAPRLVEYHDENPCHRVLYEREMRSLGMVQESSAPPAPSAKALGVTIEARYEVGEYDILILSAEESSGLITWLSGNGYRIPQGAEDIVGAYLARDMKFFVAKVSLERHDGSGMLRPIQVAYEDRDFMLPIRLGTVNAESQQELFVFALTREGRVETTNYRTVRLPSDLDVPVYIGKEFPDFYRDLFARQVEKEGGTAVFLEYAWDMSWCDPCAADPLSPSELRELGVMWLGEGAGGEIGRRRGPQAVHAFVTRLHVRYDAKTFPEDLSFQVTGDRSNFQGRYVLRHPWRGDFDDCPEAKAYARTLVERWDREAETLADLTGRSLESIRSRMRQEGFSASALGIDEIDDPERTSWWDRLWSR